MFTRAAAFTRNKSPSLLRFFCSKEAYGNPAKGNFSMTKIVGTIGPVSENAETLQTLVHEGLRVMRINFSHATYEEATLRMKNLRSSKGIHSYQQNQNFNSRAVLLDTQGPEIRCGSFNAGNDKVLLTAGNEVSLTTDDAFKLASTTEKLWISYKKLTSTVSVGDSILLDDGLVTLTVLSKASESEIRCRIENTEKMGNRKGVNLPGLIVDLPALTEKDRTDIEFGIKNDIDFIAASFVRTAADVTEIKDFVKTCHEKYWPASHPVPEIISKIENLEGILNFSDILKLSDGIMVARGDLGVEIPIQKVFGCQKDMVDKCNEAGKPVIVATQMLESMTKNPRPTRAEVSDVGNAVLDGADCVMLSGEVAQGSYPVESVQTMLRIIKEADEYQKKHDAVKTVSTVTSDAESMTSSVVKAARELDANLIIVLTESGHTARLVAKHRPNVPVMCFAESQKVARQLQVHRGLIPIVSAFETRPTSEDAMLTAKNMGWLSTGDKVVVLHAEDLSDHLGTQVTMRVAKVE